jgi:hypothetical protein
MPIGHVNTDYILFLINDEDEAAIKEKVEEIAFAIKMEYRMIQDLGEDMWEF